MKLDSNAYMVTYVSVMGVAVALLLTGVGRFTAPYKSANEEAEKIRNILQVFNVPFDARAGAGEVKALFERNVKAEQAGGKIRYLYVPTGSPQPQAVAIDFVGPGLWGPIKGLLAVEPDLTTVRGLTFYQQEETPGLGGEIASDRFRGSFAGKKIRTPAGETGIRIRSPGKASAANEVDGITGATMTCRKVETILNEAIAGLKEEGQKP